MLMSAEFEMLNALIAGIVGIGIQEHHTETAENAERTNAYDSASSSNFNRVEVPDLMAS